MEAVDMKTFYAHSVLLQKAFLLEYLYTVLQNMAGHEMDIWSFILLHKPIFSKIDGYYNTRV